MKFHLIGSQRRKIDGREGKLPDADDDYDILLECPEIDWARFNQLAGAEYDPKLVNFLDRLLTIFLWQQLAELLKVKIRDPANILHFHEDTRMLRDLLIDRGFRELGIEATPRKTDLVIYLPPGSEFAMYRFGLLLRPFDFRTGHGGHLSRGDSEYEDLPDYYSELVDMTGLP